MTSDTMLMAVVSVTIDGRAAKVTFGGRGVVGAVDFAGLAAACFEAIAASSPDRDLPGVRTPNTGSDP